MGCVHTSKSNVRKYDPDVHDPSNSNRNSLLNTNDNCEVGGKKVENTLVEKQIDDKNGFTKSVNDDSKNNCVDIFCGKSSKKSIQDVVSLTMDNDDDKSKNRVKLKTSFPIWKQYEKCSICSGDKDRTAAGHEVNKEDILKITLQYSSKPIMCKTCSKNFNSTLPNNLWPATSGGVTGSSFANLLALTALDLSAPATDAILINRKNAWIQLAGHPGSFAPAGPHTIWKKRMAKENYELKAYQSLMDSPTTQDIIPEFHREVEHNGEYFIEIEDLLQHFKDPNIMDIKMGKRTFLESEVKNPVLRKDLYQKMVDLDPNAPTAEEKKQEAITKLRYMQFREEESSTAMLGFRIEAVKKSGEAPITSLKKIKQKSQVVHMISKFLEGYPKITHRILERLKDIRDKFIQSEFFKHHEIIGSSLLIMYDESGQCGVWLIDFAKTIPVENGMILYHNLPWLLGNHEDGFLSGMDNLIDIFTDMDQNESMGNS